MKTIYLSIFLTLILTSLQFMANSQDVQIRKTKLDAASLFTPANHDPNFLKSVKFPDKSFYQQKSEWQHIIDTTWGAGVPLNEKLKIFNAYTKDIHDKFDGLHALNMNWDSLYNHYLGQIKETTSKGAFSSIMSHFAYEMKDMNTWAYDSLVVQSTLNPGVPVLLMGINQTVEHFGAVTTLLPDSSTLVLRVAPNHPLNLAPGDIILGYEGVLWKNLARELFHAGLPLFAMTSGVKSTQGYHFLMGAGLNWHLFSTIDILKHASGETVHLSLEPMAEFKLSYMANNEQLAIPNIHFPYARPWPRLTDNFISYGKMENTNIGYIYLSGEWSSTGVEDQFFNAVDSLKNTDALIIDMRLNFEGDMILSKGLDVLFNEFHQTLQDNVRCNTTTFELCRYNNLAFFQINGKGSDYYDRPIAILMGPSCFGVGDITAYLLKFHPMVRTFGASSSGSMGNWNPVSTFPGWGLNYSTTDVSSATQPENYLNRKEFPIDVPVWFNKDDVARGIDPIVEKSLEWIHNSVYAHSLVLNKPFVAAQKDTLQATAILENPNSHTVTAQLIFEALGSSAKDSTAMTPVNQEDRNHLQGTIITKELPEDLYWVSLKVNDQTDKTSFTNKHMTRLTTVPLLVDSLPLTFASTSAPEYHFQAYLKNAGKTKRLDNLQLTISSKDVWIKSIVPNQITSSYLLPGQIRRLPSFKVTVDEATFHNELNLTLTVSSDGWPYWVKDTTLSITTGTAPDLTLSEGIHLDQNFPNPFTSSSTIGWQLSKGERVTLSVTDLLGRKVMTLEDGFHSAGRYQTTVKAALLPKGIYFYQLKAGKFVQTRKMIVVR